MIGPVLADLERLTATVSPEDDQRPTPCDDFDVITLRRHLLGWLGYFDSAFTDPAGDHRPYPFTFTGPDDFGSAIQQLSATITAAFDSGMATTTVNVPHLGGAYPGSAVLDLLLVEVLGHGWDLARATDQVWQPDPQTCEHALTVLHGVIQPEYRAPGMPFAPEVAVSADAPALDRFVAFTGRNPAWVSPAR